MIFNTFATAKTSTGILSTTSSSDTDFGSFKNWILLSLVALSRLIHLRKYFLSLEHVPISAVALKTIGRSKIVSLDNLNGIKGNSDSSTYEYLQMRQKTYLLRPWYHLELSSK